MPRLGVGIGLGLPGGPSGSSPPPSAYTTGGVSFDGATSLLNAALAATDSPTLIWSVWYLIGAYPPADGSASLPIWVNDPAGGYYTYSILTNPVPSGAGQTLNGITDAASTAQTYLASDGVHDPIGATGAWHNCLFRGDITGAPVAGMYLDDALVPTTPAPFGTGPADTPFNGLPLQVGSDGTLFFTGYLADLWIGVGQDLDLSVTANRRKFISASGKPVDLGSDGSTPTGTAPAVFLRRAPSGAASTFATNRGTGGNFAITGALTNAPSSPSD